MLSSIILAIVGKIICVKFDYLFSLFSEAFRLAQGIFFRHAKELEGKKTNRKLSKRIDFFLKYFPVRVRNVGEDAVAARQLIWAFKDARDNAFEKVAQMTAAHLIKVCGEKIKDIVFVCVPASTQAKNESRYMAFCNRVSELCGIINGYSHISVSGDRLAVHEHRHDKEKSITKTQVIEFDEAYFKGKDIYVFDDVVTTGASYAIFANQLEMFGGNVLGGLFLGRTHYKYAK
jgi:predicted amidophosphoribosyltransferase